MGGAWGACSIQPISEVCNGINDDCDAGTDEGLTVTCYADFDNDGYAEADAVVSQECPDPSRTDFGGCPTFHDEPDALRGRHRLQRRRREHPSGPDGDLQRRRRRLRRIHRRDGQRDLLPRRGRRHLRTPRCQPGARCPASDRAFVGGCPVGTTNRAPTSGNVDCNDASSGQNPAATEVCDAPTGMPAASIDEDCDGQVNEPEVCECYNGQERTCGEGGAVGRCASGQQTCVTGVWGGCSISPTSEVCNGEDDDCNGFTDEGTTVICYEDADDDTFPAMGAMAQTVCPAAGRGAVGGCPFQLTNVDPASDPDCDDTDASINPNGTEICDVTMNDEDCDGTANPPGLCDCSDGTMRSCADGGLFGPCAAGEQTCVAGSWGACSVPPQVEMCNGVDDDCDGTIDDGVTVGCYADGDDDGYPMPGAVLDPQCPAMGRGAVGGCPMNFTNRRPTRADADCNDGDDSIYPLAPEICDPPPSEDENCRDGANEPTICDCYNSESRSCADDGALGECATGQQICADGAWGSCSVSPVAETCNGSDDDCDGSVDETVSITCYQDDDGDGYALPGATTGFFCSCPSGWTIRDPSVPNNADCWENDPLSYPGAPERCDGIDNDCSVGIEALEVIEDADNDGHSPTGTSVCNGGPFPKDDCDSSNPNRHGGQLSYFQSGFCPPGYELLQPLLRERGLRQRNPALLERVPVRDGGPPVVGLRLQRNRRRAAGNISGRLHLSPPLHQLLWNRIPVLGQPELRVDPELSPVPSRHRLQLRNELLPGDQRDASPRLPLRPSELDLEGALEVAKVRDLDADPLAHPVDGASRDGLRGPGAVTQGLLEARLVGAKRVVGLPLSRRAPPRSPRRGPAWRGPSRSRPARSLSARVFWSLSLANCVKSWKTVVPSGSFGSSRASLPVTIPMIAFRSFFAGKKSGMVFPLLLDIFSPSVPGTSGASPMSASGTTSVSSP